MQKQETLQAAQRRGWYVAVVLIVQTIFEYWISVSRVSYLLVWLVIINVFEAWLILEYFMHRSHWKAEE